MVSLNTGNSGDRLVETITKLGPNCQQEGAYCQHLGERVTPKIYNVFSGGYVMERLESAPRTPRLLLEIEELLHDEVWNRPALPSSSETKWQDELKKYGVGNIPPYVDFDTDYCLVHGDPTASNALLRGEDLVLCDPRPPRVYIPQLKETDMGRILQSMLGWEVVAYGAAWVNFIEPKFFQVEIIKKKAFFWCAATAARIEFLERSRTSRPQIIAWCDKVRRLGDL